MTPTITPEALESARLAYSQSMARGATHKAGIEAAILAALPELQAAPAAAGVPDGLIPASPDIEYLRSVSHGSALPALLRGNIMSALRWIDTLQTRLANPQPAQPMEDWINQWPGMPGDQLIKMRAAWGAGYHYGSSAIHARQPVGEPAMYQVRPRSFPAGEGWREVSKRQFDDRGEYPGYPEAEWERRALYTAPPAPMGLSRAALVDNARNPKPAAPQGVDLGKLRAPLNAAFARLQSIVSDESARWSEREKASNEQAALYPWLALIDSQHQQQEGGA
ncbi:hypothetical protein ACM9XA_03665 [Xanthomonas sacchari]